MSNNSHLAKIESAIHELIGDEMLPGTIGVTLPTGVEMVVIRLDVFEALSDAWCRMQQHEENERLGTSSEITEEEQALLNALDFGRVD